jgi:hypothetical protein
MHGLHFFAWKGRDDLIGGRIRMAWNATVACGAMVTGMRAPVDRHCCLSCQHAGIAEAVIAIFTDDYVIKELYAEDFTGLADPLSKEDVITAWGWIPTRMIVTENDGSRRIYDGGFVHFPGCPDRGCEPAHGYNFDTDNEILGIQHEAYEALPISLHEIVFQDGNNVFGIVNRSSLFGLELPIANELDMINGNVFKDACERQLLIVDIGFDDFVDGFII